MIRQEIYLSEYDWLVHCYFAVDAYYVDEIVEKLQEIGCDGEYLRRARANMESGRLNHGLTFSSVGESVLVVGITSSASQFLNSFSHELHHLVCHISEARGIDVNSEEAAYLCGDISQETFPHVIPLLCEHCRTNKKVIYERERLHT